MQKTESSRSYVLTFALVFGCVFTQGASAEAGTVFVAVNGSDSWSGLLAEPNAERTDGPLATLDAACRATRRQVVDVQFSDHIYTCSTEDHFANNGLGEVLAVLHKK